MTIGEEQQNRLILNMLEHAVRNVPYYSKLAAGLRRPLTLDQFPIMDKETIRSDYSAFHSADREMRGAYQGSSSGSTGKPILVLNDRDFKTWSRVAEDYFQEKFLGAHLPELSKVILWAIPQRTSGSEYNLRRKLRLKLTRTLFVDTFFVKDFGILAAAINRRKPQLIQGYSYSLYYLSRYAQIHNLKMHSPKWIVTTAEMMYPHMRETVEQVFKCRVHNFYASREVGPLAGECSRGNYHVIPGLNYIKILDRENKASKPGEEGRLIVTGLRKFAMPLIQYNIGDRAIASSGCDCGLPGQVFASLIGRVTDYFPLRNGAAVDGGYFMHMMQYRDWIDEFQFVQTDFDKIEFHYTKLKEPEPTELERISGSVREVMGEDCEVVIKEVEEIKRGSHGKYLHARSLVQAGMYNQNS
jgi:phenylacetate-CoA ligase